ncbi:MAG: tyrosine recombinase xerd, integrase/recombinase XerD [Candidatus Woesebacteria bacterium GW2011_GWF1_31_35]|nr:MAG: tyrosine recombinase xerd, integrase/recombinase XerD [Candidatus Woesebacteria bacterium GW2011_GWF1_31_35]
MFLYGIISVKKVNEFNKKKRISLNNEVEI